MDFQTCGAGPRLAKGSNRMSGNQKHERDCEELRRECERLGALQKAGKLPLLDTGGISVFDLIPEIVRTFYPIGPRVSVPSKIDGAWIN